MPRQQKNPAKNPDTDIRAKIQAAKTTLGLKDLNVAAALAGHRMFQSHSAKNPELPVNQILNKISPNARKNYLKLASAVPSNLLNRTATTSQFRNTMQKLKQATSMMNLNNSFVIKNENELLEAAKLRDELNPPIMLVLKRRGIRIFPDGKRVALYVNDKLGLTFTIPYTPRGSSAKETLPGVQAEEIQVLENIEHIKDIIDKKQEKQIKFADGTSVKVDHTTATAIHNVHNSLSDQNKIKFAKMLNHSKGQFKKAADFSLNQHKFVINK